jgi:hypothetical protein
MPFTYHRLSDLESLLQPVQDRSSVHQSKAIDDLVSSNLLLIELLSHFPFAHVEYKKVEGGEGGQEEGWVVEIGVTHTISEKNSDNSYSKKIFPNKFSAKLALKKHVMEMQKVIQLYVEDEPTDEEWRNSLKLHGKQRESRKGCGQPKT